MGFLRRLLRTAVDQPTTPNVRVRDVAPDLDVPALPELEDRETPIPEDGYRLVGGPSAYGIAAVGESHQRDALVRVTGGLRAGGVHMQLTAALAREPDNGYDPNAVSVRIDGETVAYMPRAIALAYGPVLERVAELGRMAYCSVLIRGGWDRGAGSRADFSVGLLIDSPKSQMVHLDRETVDTAARADPRAAYANTGCPYCSAPLDPLPKAKKKCPACGQPIYVRRAPDGLRYLLQEQDLPALDKAWTEIHDDRDDVYR
jgi:hypothetical protein